VQQGLPFEVHVDRSVASYQIVLPFVPPSKNKYDGWLPAWKSGAKKKWIRAIQNEVTIQQIPAVEKVGIACELMFMSKAHRDPQNYAQCLWNWVPDALQQAGVIPDDGPGRVEIGPNWGVRMVLGPRQQTRIVLSLVVEQWRL
jgi:hypothetical protein